jgi:hypothetical protein
MCEAVVWTNVFREIGLAPMHTSDTSASINDVFKLIRQLRPYQSLRRLGRDSYQSQCYFITHLTFILSGWGAIKLVPRSLFIEEYLFLTSNMDVVIAMKDPELVGEFLQVCLSLLDHIIVLCD